MTFLERLEWGITSINLADSAQTALFLDDYNNYSSPTKTSLRARTKTVTISTVMNELCSNLTETKIKVFKLKMPPVRHVEKSPTHSGSGFNHSASLRYVLNFLKSKTKAERSVAASRRAQKL